MNLLTPLQLSCCWSRLVVEGSMGVQFTSTDSRFLVKKSFLHNSFTV